MPDMNSIRSMKAFLTARRVPHADCLDKESLQERVRQTLAAAPSASQSTATESKSTASEAGEPRKKVQFCHFSALISSVMQARTLFRELAERALSSGLSYNELSELFDVAESMQRKLDHVIEKAESDAIRRRVTNNVTLVEGFIDVSCCCSDGLVNICGNSCRGFSQS